jgi:hypothetical protein
MILDKSVVEIVERKSLELAGIMRIAPVAHAMGDAIVLPWRLFTVLLAAV